jgi:hypothetical protein
VRDSVLIRIFGIECHCLGLQRLIQVKRAAGRPKDLEAVAELEAIDEERRTEDRAPRSALSVSMADVAPELTAHRLVILSRARESFVDSAASIVRCLVGRLADHAARYLW